jgi:predicted unusual protein kinase regulating ubiquinone biosynthesis (AarF/ABC1/UbiB family)
LHWTATDEVAVKIQYPGISRTIRADVRNLLALMTPLRVTRDWENGKEQLEELARALETETDYEQEARTLEKARSLFHEDDGVIVPHVYAEYSTRRVLTMEFVKGMHIHEFLAGRPSQELRNHFGEKMMLAWYRMLFSGRMNYIDWHPGNFLLAAALANVTNWIQQ